LPPPRRRRTDQGHPVDERPVAQKCSDLRDALNAVAPVVLCEPNERWHVDEHDRKIDSPNLAR
jgi:hypothetical protein